MRFLIIFSIAVISIFANTLSKNVLILDEKAGFFSKQTLPSVSGYKYNIYEVRKLQEDIINFNDTFVLFQSLVSDISEDNKKLIVEWVRNGGKLLIMHKDSEKAYNRFDWLPYGYKFSTNSASSNGEGRAKLAKISEYNFLTKSLDVDGINNNSNAFSDSNVMIFHENFWNSSLVVTNVNDVTGPSLAYAKYGKGMIVYCGLSMRDIHKNSSLNDLYKTILSLPWNPDPLPYTNASSVEIPSPLLRISGISSKKVDIAWKVPAWLKGIRGYKIYRSTDEGVTKNLIADVSGVNFYRDLNASDGVTYLYYVTSYDESRDSSFSMPVMATPPGDVASEEAMMLVTPDGNYTEPLTALTTTDNFDHVTGDAFFTSQKIAGDPVSLATGGFYLMAEDIKMNSKSVPLEFVRSYNSIFKDSSENFRMGNGWRHNYMISIYSNADGTLSVKWGDGHADVYLKADDDGKSISFEPASNRVYSKLKKIRDEGYTLRTKENTLYRFNENGSLVMMEAKDKSALIFEYDYDRLIKVTDRRSSRYITLLYEGDNISKACAMDKMCSSYKFDEKNNLIEAKDTENSAVRYEYNEKYQMTASYGSDDGALFKNAYKNGQVVSQSDPMGAVTKFEYLKDGVTKVTDREGRTSIYRHDTLGRLTKETDALGKSLYYYYNTKGEVVKRVSKDETSKEYNYDEAGNLIFSKDENANVKSMEYDKNSNILSVTDENGNESTFAYDDRHRVVQINDSLGNSTKYSYDKNGDLESVTDPNGGVISYVYDDKGDLVELKDAMRNVKRYRYDEYGRRLASIDENGNSVVFEYDTKNRVTKITDANGNSITNRYDRYGNIVSKTNPNGSVTGYEYDKNLRMTKKVDAAGNATLYSYSKEGNLIQETDARGNRTLYEYDALNRKTAIIAADGSKTEISYNPNEKIASFTDALGNKITMSYDKKALLKETLSPLKNVSSTTYTKNALAKTMIDQLGREKEFIYDMNNRITAVIDQQGNKTQNRYDGNGNKVATVLHGKNVIEYSYDKNNQLTLIREQDKKETRFFYDKRKALAKIEFPSKKQIEFFYDKANRLIGKKSGDVEHRYELDANGNRVKIFYDNGSSVATRRYDVLNRLLSHTDQYSNTVSYKYDKAQNLRELTYSDGSAAKYEYDSMNRLKSVTDFNGNTTTYNYFADGKIAGVKLPDGFVVSYEYDGDGRLIKKSDRKEKYTLSSYSYILNKAGERIKEGKKEPLAAKDEAYEMDMSYNGANMLTRCSKFDVMHDEDGNVIKRASVNKNLYMEYDDFGRMVSKNGTEYRYDADNLRIIKKSAAGEERYIYDISTSVAKLIEIHDKDGNIKKKFVYGLGLISESDKNGTYVYHYDTRGSTVAITDVKGEIRARYGYDIYGKVRASEGEIETFFTYVGQYGVMDDGDGLYFMRTREYDSELMRFIQKDRILLGTVINSQSMNRYTYVEGDPVRGIDPMGAWFLGDDILASGLGALIEIAKQVVTDIVEGELSSPQTYIAAAVKGATKAQVLLYTANISLAEASGTFAGDIAKQGMEIASGQREEIDYKGALKSAAASAASASLFDPSSAKAATGFDEAFEQVKKHAKSTIKNIAPRVTELIAAPEKAKEALKESGAIIQNSDVKLYKFK